MIIISNDNMKAQYTIDVLPQSGVKVKLEGMLLRLLFDFTPAEPVQEEGEEAPENLYNCESVDVNGRSKGEIISAIINDRYTPDAYQAILANYELAKDSRSGISSEKKAEYLAEYQAFQTWRTHAKEIAAIVVSLIA